MFKRSFLILSSFILCLFIGCKKTAKEIPALYPQKVMQEFEGDTFLSDLRTVWIYDGNIYFNSFSERKFYILNNELYLKSMFGKGGKGPGEFTWAGNFFVRQDSIYAYDGAGSRMHVFNNRGEFQRSISLPPIDLTFKRFFLSEKKLYMPAPVYSDQDIIIADVRTGETLNEIDIKNQETEGYMNTRTILRYEDQLITVDLLNPFIERLTESGEVIEAFDLRTITELEGLWRHYENHKSQNHLQSYTSIFADAYINDSLLYVLCEPWPERDNYSFIIKLKVNDKRIAFKDILKIQGSSPSAIYFHSIAVNGDRLIAIEGSTHTLNEFDLSEID